MCISIRIAAQKDTLYSYEELQLYSGSSDTIYLDEGYRSGLFEKNIENKEGNDGSIIASAVFPYSWSRDITNNEYFPEWWDENNNNGTDQVQRAVSASPAYANIILRENKTYLIDRTLTLNLGQHLKGANTTLKRNDRFNSKLLTPCYGGDSIIVVSEAHRLLIGLGIIITDTTSTTLGLHRLDNNIHSDNTRPLVSTIHGDTIFLSSPIKLPRSGNLDTIGYYPIGSPVFHANTMIKQHPLGADSITIFGNHL